MPWFGASLLKGAPRRATVADSCSGSAPQILVDVSVIYQRDAQTGIQRVVRGILLQLMKQGASGHAVLPVFATRDHGYHYASLDFLTDPSSMAGWRARPTEPVHCGQGDIFLGLDLAAHLLPRHRAQVARWKAAGASIQLLVYDLLPIRQPQWFQRKTVRNFRRWLNFLADHCDSALCISRDTEQDLRLWIATNFPGRLATFDTHVIRLGGEIGSTAPSRGVSSDARHLLDQRAARPFILMVGTVEPRKGHDAAIDAFESLWSGGGDTVPDLVIVGRPGWKTERLQRRIQRHPETQRRLFWFDDASDELLDQLYRGCQGVVVPSYAEGFGLPVEEARRYGKAVLARDLAVFRESGRQAVSFFPDDAGFAEALAAWTADIAHLDEDCRVSEPRSWDETRMDLLRALGIDAAASGNDRLPLLPSIVTALP